MRAGRPVKTYTASYDANIKLPGLSRQKDRRWRVLFPDGSEKRFAEDDEHKAIARYHKLHGTETLNRTSVEVSYKEFLGTDLDGISNLTTDQINRLNMADAPIRAKIGVKASDLLIQRLIEDEVLYPWIYNQLATNGKEFAAKVGVPSLADLAHTLRQPSIKIADLTTFYTERSRAGKTSKSKAMQPFNRMVKFIGAKTLADLTNEKLDEFCQHMESDQTLKSSGTLQGYYSGIRGIIRFGRRSPRFNRVEIAAALERCALLRTDKETPEDDPRPISREDFHSLLAGVTKTNIPETWRAMLLLGLNAALYMADLCNLTWDMLDLKECTFLARRKKKGKCIRAATLWAETVEAVKSLPRRGSSPYVFVSNRGTRYNRQTKINDFKDFREKIGLPDVRWSHLRDGAYTAASHDPDVEDKYARLLAGHRASGLQDKYVLRHPECVRPACVAIHKFYGPFLQV